MNRREFVKSMAVMAVTLPALTFAVRDYSLPYRFRMGPYTCEVVERPELCYAKQAFVDLQDGRIWRCLFDKDDSVQKIESVVQEAFRRYMARVA